MLCVILNSGIGKRLEELTKDKPKCLISLYNNETILERQLKILKSNGIEKFLITTGPFEEKIKEEVKNKFPKLSVTYIHNNIYDSTNYIYSIYLASKNINDDILLLHGDLVFNNELIKEILKQQYQNIALINKSSPLPKKDFKALIDSNYIKKISVDISEESCYTFMPIYKLEKEKFNIWLDEIDSFIKNGKLNVYAEEAFNNISYKINVKYFDYANYYCKEIDDKTDLYIVNNEVQKYD